MVLADEVEVLNGGGTCHITGLVIPGSGLLIFVPEFLGNPGVWTLQGKIFLIPLATNCGNNTPSVKTGRQLAFFIKADGHG
jgi:hypothetical protein